MGGSNSYGDRLFVFGKDSRSDGFKKKSVIALTGVIKLRSKDDVDLLARIFFFAANVKKVVSKCKLILQVLPFFDTTSSFIGSLDSVDSASFIVSPFPSSLSSVELIGSIFNNLSFNLPSFSSLNSITLC